MGIERDIIRLYDQNLRAIFTIRGMAKDLGLAYPYVHRTVSKLLAVGVLRAVTAGGSRLLSLDLRNRRTVLYLTELELEKRAALPEATRALADKLDKDGTLAIETVVVGEAGVYLVGAGTFPGTTTITRDELRSLLLTTSLFKSHTVLHGYERFFGLLAANQAALDEAYNPLLVTL